jgi:hypothetical protein
MDDLSMPDNTAKSDTAPEAKAEAASSSAKPVLTTSQAAASIEKLRNALLTGGGIGFFYALFHSLNISLARGFWWLILVSAAVFTVAIFRRRTK